MCELFAMSSLHPATISFSLEEFSKHGGVTGPHKDGWGIAFYEGMDVKVIREASSAGASPYIDFINSNSFTSNITISHIRLATQGKNSLQNTQPFSRELGGRMHVFAHNGDLDNIVCDRFPLDCFRPIGDTDSEYAFCYLLHLMQDLWLKNNPPTLEQRFQVISVFAEQIRPLGPANFVYSDGEYLFVHGHKRTQAEKKEPQPPGLHVLHRVCRIPGHETRISGLNVDYGKMPQEVVLVASVPLTDESWRPMDEGEILILKKGVVTGLSQQT